MMGLIFLGGTIVNNSILLLDFILRARRDGMAKDEAILQSVRLRIRPILMTTVSTIVGLTPLIFEMAVGLERMSPLGIVAATGLLVGTFLTMIVIPVVYSSLDTAASVAGSVARWGLGLNPHLHLKSETVPANPTASHTSQR
jgi:multidrug efflux pump subunit AcrB